MATMNLKVVSQTYLGKHEIKAVFDISGLSSGQSVNVICQSVDGKKWSYTFTSNGTDITRIFNVDAFGWYKVYMKDSLGNISTTKTVLVAIATVGQGIDTLSHTFTKNDIALIGGSTGLTVDFIISTIIAYAGLQIRFLKDKATATKLLGAFIGARIMLEAPLSQLPQEGYIVKVREYQYYDRIECYLHYFNANYVPLMNPVKLCTTTLTQF
ncbi:hypothetical protein [Thermotalea metallivorans]|uniref:Uncharacterized protein n=1 Tax=Thermotalea metallivorans TaxID=520762 RepID=A0A140L395_9FIRM|nr:hypothetical protein [Thermotalea metallivorans]KXG75020.1 hypothetical protein AN619_19900 [Thermotalea metallivorans]